MKTINNKHLSKNKTRRIYPHPKKIQIHGRIVKVNNGWKQLILEGNPQQRGFAHGYLLYKEIEELIRCFPFIIRQELECSYSKYLKLCKRVISPIIKEYYPEFYQEIDAITRGVLYQNPEIKVTTDILIAWNSITSMYEYIHNKPQPRKKCSAFIANGSFTKDGKIVMGHTTHTDLVSGKFTNIISYIKPKDGYPFIMQHAPGYIASETDWFITTANIIGCETTIGDITYRPIFDKNHHPYFCRIRKAMQYARSLDQYAEIMKKNNAGDYASSWLFGNIETNEIMLCELGLDVVNIEKTKDGVFYGMNSAISMELRYKETNDEEFADMETSSGARNARFQQLFKKYKGKITPQIAINILSDHIDPLTQKEKRGISSICVHTYDEPNGDYSNYPHGCTDLKVIDTQMAKQMKFQARFGPACGEEFNKNEFIKRYHKYSKFSPYLDNFPHQPITTIEFLS